MAEFVEVCSYRMGSSKTNKVIQWMKDNPQEKYIYVIPNLSELQDTEESDSRILSIGFKTPEVSIEYKTKRDDFYAKLCASESIACTHALYKMLERKHLDKIKELGYIIVIDEEVNLIDNYVAASTADLVSLLNDGKVEINSDDGLVIWIADEKVTEPYLDKNHKHNKFYRHIINEYIYTSRCTKSEDGKYKNVFMTSQLTKDLISCAKRLIIITYLFQGSILESFLTLKGFKVKKFEDIGIVETPLDEIVSRITLLPYDKRMAKYKMNATWWNSVSKEDVLAVNNFIRRVATKVGYPSDEVMWTCSSKRVREVASKKVQYYVAPSGYTKDSKGETLWISCSMRATNKYRHKKLAIHCYDRYPHVSVATYLQDYGVKVDRDRFAISELLQWLFRGNARVENGEMVLAIASKRMYDLYVKWTEGGFKDEF